MSDDQPIMMRDYGPPLKEPLIDWLIFARGADNKFDRETEDQLLNLYGVTNGVGVETPGVGEVKLVVYFRVVGLKPLAKYRLGVLQADAAKGIVGGSVTAEGKDAETREDGSLQTGIDVSFSGLSFGHFVLILKIGDHNLPAILPVYAKKQSA